MGPTLHPAAVAEAREARRWYAARSPALAQAFMAELERALTSIASAPERWPPQAGFRRHVMRRFTFLIVYRIAGDGVEILAIAHASRRPDYWSDR